MSRDILDRLGSIPLPINQTVGRIVAENNIHKEVKAFLMSPSNKKLAIVGNFNKKDKYSQYLYKLRGKDPRIVFCKPIYYDEVLGTLRKNCYAYIHYYEIGGTNPSLLEQMLFGKPVLAYDVPFHREVLEGDGGIYFRDEDDLVNCMERLENGAVDLSQIKRHQAKRIEEEYNWDDVTKKYNFLLRQLLATNSE